MLDISGLKVINDSFGHYIGNMILAEIGRCLKMLSNLYDCCARWGGDEFVILMNKTDEQRTQQIVKLRHESSV